MCSSTVALLYRPKGPRQRDCGEPIPADSYGRPDGGEHDSPSRWGCEIYWYGPVVTNSASTFSDIGAPQFRPRWTRAHTASPNPIKNRPMPMPSLENGVAHDGMVTFEDSRANDQEHDHKYGDPKADELSDSGPSCPLCTQGGHRPCRPEDDPQAVDDVVDDVHGRIAMVTGSTSMRDDLPSKRPLRCSPRFLTPRPVAGRRSKGSTA